jgi:hypothetical protein
MFRLLPANTTVPAGGAYVAEYGMVHWFPGLNSWYNTDSRSKLRVHFVKNSLFSRRDNKRQRAV